MAQEAVRCAEDPSEVVLIPDTRHFATVIEPISSNWQN